MILELDGYLDRETMLCELAVQHCYEPFKTVMILSSTKTNEMALRKSFDTFYQRLSVFSPNLLRHNKSELCFDNDSRIFFRVARPYAGKGLSISLLIINNASSIKDLDEIKKSLYPSLLSYGNGKVILVGD